MVSRREIELRGIEIVIGELNEKLGEKLGFGKGERCSYTCHLV